MSQSVSSVSSNRARKAMRNRLITFGVVVLVLIGVVAGTKIVPNDDPLLVGEEKFDSETFGPNNFPAVQEEIEDHAIDAGELAAALADDDEAAIAQYAEEASGSPIFSVSLTGVAGEGSSGIYEVDADGVPEDLLIRVQTGPAINGTELRDATGMMSFGDFANQIDFQDAGSALNEEMKRQVLDEIDTENLEGQTIKVTGAFTYINPDAWLITPVTLEVE